MPFELDRHDSGRVGEIPNRHRACFMGCVGESPEVVTTPGPEVDLRKRQHPGFDRIGHLFRFDNSKAASGELGYRGEHIKICREVAGIGQDVAIDQVGRRKDRFVQIDRGGVGARHGAGASSDERRDEITDTSREIEPSRVPPSANEQLLPVAPQLRHGFSDGAYRWPE